MLHQKLMDFIRLASTPPRPTPPPTPATARHTPSDRVTTEAKASFKTSELVAYVVVVLGVLIASAMVDTSDFGAQEAWQ